MSTLARSSSSSSSSSTTAKRSFLTLEGSDPEEESAAAAAAPTSSPYWSIMATRQCAPSLENVANLEKLGSCELNQRVRFSVGRACIEVFMTANGKSRWTTVCGLLERLRECFYPQYDFLRANALARKYANNNAKTTLATPHPAFTAEAHRLGKRARELGELVDREHSTLVNQQVSGDDLSDAAGSSSSSTTDLSLYTRVLFTVKQRWQWHSYMAQFIVCAPDLGVGTRIDELCYNDSLELIVVEHKVGYKGYRTRGTAMMNEPLTDIDNSPQNQHFLQCGFGVLMLERYWNVVVHGAFVVYIDDAEVLPQPLPEWFWERREAIWQRFAEQMNRRFR